MQRRSLMGLGVLVLGLCLAAPQRAQAVDVKLLPNGTESVTCINLHQILDAEMFQDDKMKFLVNLVKSNLNNFITKDENIARYVQFADFDLFRDISAITVASPSDKDQKKNAIIISGKFSPEKIRAAVEAAKGDGKDIKRTDVNDADLYEVNGIGDSPIYVGIPSETTVFVGGNRQIVVDALARAAGQAKNNLPADFTKLVTKNGKNAISMTATGKAFASMANGNTGGDGQAAQAVQNLSNINTMSVCVNVAKDITLKFGVDAKDATTARNLRDQADRGMTTLRTMISDNQDNPTFSALASILKTVNISQEENSLTIEAEGTFANIMSLVSLIPQ